MSASCCSRARSTSTLGKSGSRTTSARRENASGSRSARTDTAITANTAAGIPAATFPDVATSSDITPFNDITTDQSTIIANAVASLKQIMINKLTIKF